MNQFARRGPTRERECTAYPEAEDRDWFEADERKLLARHKAKERKRLALHDGAHAVIGRAFGAGVDHVSMIADKGSLARVSWSVSWGRWLQPPKSRLRRLRAIAVISYAGMVAERMAGFRLNAERAVGHIIDRRIINAIVKEMHLLAAGLPVRRNKDDSLKMTRGTSIPDEDYAALEREAEALVAQHWPAIERVARALCRSDHLTQSEVDCLIAAASTVAVKQQIV